METKEVIAKMKDYINEIGGDLVSNTGSHKGVMHLSISDSDGNDYIVENIEPSRRMGCGCWDGIYITIAKEPLA